MKVKLLVFALFITLVSCEKEHDFDFCDKKEKLCATIDQENLPREVITVFNQKYTGASQITWFDKDEKAFVAVFTFNGKETKAKFEKNGAFVKEEIEGGDDEGEENDIDDEGCSCDIGGNDKD